MTRQVAISIAVLLIAFGVWSVWHADADTARIKRISVKWASRLRTNLAGSLAEWGITVFETPISQQPELTGGRSSIRIWPIGDSITEAQTGYSSYRYWLWKKLQETGQTVEFVGTKNGVLGGEPAQPDFDQSHNGYFGYRADDVVPLIRDAATEVSFDIALVHLGTNDLGWGETPEQIVSDLTHLLAVLRARNPRATVLFAQIIPTQFGDEPFIALNREIALFAKREYRPDSPVIAVDQFTGFDATQDTYDGIHPTEPAEEKIAERWFAALQPVLRSFPK